VENYAMDDFLPIFGTGRRHFSHRDQVPDGRTRSRYRFLPSVTNSLVIPIVPQLFHRTVERP
jgi:hypothetical protein